MIKACSLLRRVLLLWLVCSGLLPAYAATTIVIGVLAEDRLDVEQPRWNHLAAYLEQQRPDWRVEVRVHTLDELDIAIQYHQLDYVLTDPGHLSHLQHQVPYAKSIATLVRRIGDRAVPALAGVIVVHASRSDLGSLDALVGKRIVTGGVSHLGGFQSQLEILDKHKVPLETIMDSTLVEPVARWAINALRDGEAEAAFLRAGVLEEMAFKGDLSLDDFRVLEPQLLPGYPFMVSTRLYPDWPFLALTPSSTKTSRELVSLLLNLEAESTYARAIGVYGFDMPASYVAVDELVRKLRLAPYDAVPSFTLGDVWGKYREWLLSLIVAAAIILMLLVGMLILVRRLQRASQIAEQSNVALEKSEGMLRTVLDQAPHLAVQWYDREGRVRYWNEASASLYGWSALEAEGKQPDQLHQSPLQARECRAQMRALASGAAPGRVVENRYRDVNGRVIVVLSTMIMISAPAGELFVVMDVDVTQMREAESSLGKERALTRAMLQALPDMVWLKSPNGTYLQCNQRLSDYFGVPIEDILGHKDVDFVSPDMADAFISSDRDVMLTRSKRRYEHVFVFASDGHKETVEVTKAPLVDERGTLLGVIGVAHDVTAARAAQVAKVQSQARYRSLVETSQDWIWEMDSEGCITYSSPIIWNLLEYSASHVEGILLYNLVADRNREQIRRLFIDHLADAKPLSHVEAAFRHRSGREVVLEISAVPVLDAGGDLRGYRGISRDITARIASERALRESQERFDLAMQATNDGLWDWDMVTDEIYFSPRWKGMLGYGEDELDNQLSTWKSLVEAGDLDRTGRQIHEMIESGRDGLLTEYRMRHKDGSWHIMLSRSVLLRDLDGQPLRMVGTHTDVTESVRSQEELAEAQRIAHVGHWRLDHLTGNLSSSEELHHIFGCVPGAYALDERDYLAHVHPEDRERVAQAFAAHYADQAVMTITHRLLLPDGQYRYVTQSCETEFDHDGLPLTSLGVVHDVTQQKALEARLHDSEIQANLIIDTSLDGLVVTDEHGKLVRINPMITRMFGYTEEELLGKPVDVLLQKADRDFHRRLVTAYLKAPDVRSIQYGRDKRLLKGLRRDGESIPLEITLSPVMLHGKQHVVASLRAVSTRIAWEKSLQESKARLRAERDFVDAVLDAAGAIIMVMDSDGNIVRFNHAAETITGYHFEEVSNRPLWERLIPPEERGEVQRVLRSGDKQALTGSFEAEWVMKDGTRRLFDWRNSVLCDDQGRVDFVISQGYDITDKRAAEDALISYRDHLEELVDERTVDLDEARKEAERLLQVKSEFLANMSHEIRTPLNAVLGLAQIGIGLSDASREKVHLNYQRILDSGQHLLGLVNGILDFSKADAGKLVLESLPVVLGDAVDRAIGFVAGKAQEKGLELVVLEDRLLPETIIGDQMRLTQILVNLLSNAVKFTRQGAIGFSICVEDALLVFRVTDTGIGMTQEQQERMFEAFEQANTSTTREFGGTGLGMAITKRLVDMMGGKIVVHSWVDVGTTVEVHLPLDSSVTPLVARNLDCTAIRVAGFESAEQDNIVTVLQASDICFDSCSLDRAFVGLAPGEGVLLPEAAFSDDEFVAWVGELLSTPLPVHALRRPGSPVVLPDDLADRVQLLDWPLRPRHFCCQSGDGRQSSARAMHTRKGGRLAGLSIVAAEDNDINRIVLEDLLHKEKADVVFADNGQMLLDLVESIGPAQVDMVLMDIQMPVMDGHEATRLLLQRHPRMPVIGLTAHAMSEERERCFASGMRDHVTKPIVADVLVEAIRRQIDGQGVAVASSPATSETHADSVAQTPVDMAQLIDWQALGEHFGHREAFIHKVLSAIHKSHAESPGKLGKIIEARDYEQLAFLAHSLKGTAGNMKAHGLFELAKITEAAARAKDETAWDVASRLSAYLAEVMVELESRLELEQS